MKKFAAMFLSIMLVLSLVPVYADGEWTGTGTAEDPYVISDAEGLKLLADNVDGGEAYAGTYFKLGADIDLEGYDFNIGYKNWDENVAPFSGNFDGDGYKVYNYTYYEDSAAALFGYVVGSEDSYAVIRNLIVEGDVSGTKWVGGIAGYATYADITNCISYVNLTNNSWEYTGGIIGEGYNVNLNNCINYGYIDCTGSKCRTGGIVGSAANVYIYDCVNYGTINIDNCAMTESWSGGIAGRGEYQLHVFRCMNVGDIIAPTLSGGIRHLGGIVGSSKYELTIGGCLNIGDIVDNHTISSCDTGGIAGKVDNNKASGGWSNVYDNVNLGNGGQAGLVGSLCRYSSVYNNYVKSDNPSPFVGWSQGDNQWISNNYLVGEDNSEDGYASLYTLVTENTVLDDTLTNLLTAGDHHNDTNPWIEVDGEPALVHHVEPAISIAGADNTYVRFNVNPANLASQTVLVAVYNSDELVGMKKMTFNDMRVDFDDINAATDVKVFVWDTVSGAKPLVAAAELSL